MLRGGRSVGGVKVEISKGSLGFETGGSVSVVAAVLRGTACISTTQSLHVESDGDIVMVVARGQELMSSTLNRGSRVIVTSLACRFSFLHPRPPWPTQLRKNQVNSVFCFSHNSYLNNFTMQLHKVKRFSRILNMAWQSRTRCPSSSASSSA